MMSSLVLFVLFAKTKLFSSLAAIYSSQCLRGAHWEDFVCSRFTRIFNPRNWKRVSLLSYTVSRGGFRIVLIDGFLGNGADNVS